MKVAKILIPLVFLLTELALAKPETWVIDQAHSKVEFEIPHLIISSVEGRFTEFSGEIMFDSKATKNVKDFSVSTEIQAASINTGNDKRDQHLRSPDFFNVKKHKTLTFKSSKISSKDGKIYSIVGDLTIAGVKKSVTLDVKYLGTAELYGVKRAIFKASTEINRQDFGLSWNDGETKSTSVAGKIAEATGAVGDQVTITLSIQAKRAVDLK